LRSSSWKTQIQETRMLLKKESMTQMNSVPFLPVTKLSSDETPIHCAFIAKKTKTFTRIITSRDNERTSWSTEKWRDILF
jgi:hypothetical protein